MNTFTKLTLAAGALAFAVCGVSLTSSASEQLWQNSDPGQKGAITAPKGSAGQKGIGHDLPFPKAAGGLAGQKGGHAGQKGGHAGQKGSSGPKAGSIGSKAGQKGSK